MTQRRCATALDPRRGPATKPCEKPSAQPTSAPLPARVAAHGKPTRPTRQSRAARAEPHRGVAPVPVGPPPVRTHACASVGTRTGRTPRAARSLTHARPTHLEATSLARALSSSHTRVPYGTHGPRGTALKRVERRSGVKRWRVYDGRPVNACYQLHINNTEYEQFYLSGLPR